MVFLRAVGLGAGHPDSFPHVILQVILDAVVVLLLLLLMPLLLLFLMLLMLLLMLLLLLLLLLGVRVVIGVKIVYVSCFK